MLFIELCRIISIHPVGAVHTCRLLCILHRIGEILHALAAFGCVEIPPGISCGDRKTVQHSGSVPIIAASEVVVDTFKGFLGAHGIGSVHIKAKSAEKRLKDIIKVIDIGIPVIIICSVSGIGSAGGGAAVCRTAVWALTRIP